VWCATTAKWLHCGYHEIQQPPERYRIIDQSSLLSLTHHHSQFELQQHHFEWIAEELKKDKAKFRDARWTQGLAVGPREYVETVKNELGGNAIGRECIELEEGCELREERG